jgi:LTXXQ motif family protein
MQAGTLAKGVVAVLVAAACLATNADARHRRSWQWSEPSASAPRNSSSSVSELPSQAEPYANRRLRDADFAYSAPFRRSGGLAAVIGRLVRGCAQQGFELANWPFGTIAKVVVPDEVQSGALEQLRTVTQQAAETLATTCPQTVPAEPVSQLEAVEQAIDAVGGAFAAVQPALQGFYGRLDDEQKARLLRDFGSRGPQDQGSRGERRRADVERYRSQRKGETERSRAAPLWSFVCEQLTVALRGWPVREVERNVRLSETQRVSFYELVTASLQAADTLASTCPVDTALTPARRMDLLRQRLVAVREATVAVRPTLLRFFGALDQQQKLRFAGLS